MAYGNDPCDRARNAFGARTNQSLWKTDRRIFFTESDVLPTLRAIPVGFCRWLLMTVLGLVTAFVMNQKVDWRDVASKRIEASPRAANMSADQKEQQLAMSAKVSPGIAYGFGFLGPIVAVVVVAAVMLLAYNVIGGAGANFTVALGVVSHAFVVGLIGTAFFILILYLKPPGSVDLDNPVATNVGAFLPESTPQGADGSGEVHRHIQHLDADADCDWLCGVQPEKAEGQRFRHRHRGLGSCGWRSRWVERGFSPDTLDE